MVARARDPQCLAARVSRLRRHPTLALLRPDRPDQPRVATPGDDRRASSRHRGRTGPPAQIPRPPTDRPRAGRYELTYDEFERWAEPLDTNVTRALDEHLARSTPTDRIVVFPWPRGIPIDYQVTVEVAHFFGQCGDAAALMAHWSTFQEEGTEALGSRTSRFSAAAGGAPHEALVAAMSQTVAELSGEIATAIRALAARASTR